MDRNDGISFELKIWCICNSSDIWRSRVVALLLTFRSWLLSIPFYNFPRTLRLKIILKKYFWFKNQKTNANIIQLILFLHVKRRFKRRNLTNCFRILKIKWDRLNNNFSFTSCYPTFEFSWKAPNTYLDFRFFWETSNTALILLRSLPLVVVFFFLKKNIFLQFPQTKTEVLSFHFRIYWLFNIVVFSFLKTHIHTERHLNLTPSTYKKQLQVVHNVERFQRGKMYKHQIIITQVLEKSISDP